MTENNIASSHYWQFPSPPDSEDGFDDDADAVGKYVCVHYVYCHALHFALAKATVDKLVLRNV